MVHHDEWGTGRLDKELLINRGKLQCELAEGSMDEMDTHTAEYKRASKCGTVDGPCQAWSSQFAALVLTVTRVHGPMINGVGAQAGISAQRRAILYFLLCEIRFRVISGNNCQCSDEPGKELQEPIGSQYT